ncbi:MAG TPA: ThiF family adenylyltransferase [Alphaproteobacteria bacterium]|nr:ThiF family adenylyltransferase [Alphaproteobacteria bacterium]HNS44631.1 ThiF family adenylyltransferase [Alphaproteobacteria bacterium]
MTDDKIYAESFSRNIGVISEDEQRILQQLTVCVAGLGGIGGAVVSILARMGVGHFKIADIDTFDIKNINRQVSSSHSSLGKKKVHVLRDLIKDINPHAQVECFEDGVQDYNVDSFLEGADIVVDAIDFFCFSPRNILQSACYRLKKPVLFSAPLGVSATFLMFAPGGVGFKEYFDFKDELDNFGNLIRFTIGLTPSALHLKYMDFRPERLVEIQTGPSLCPSVHLGGAIIAVELLKYVTKKAEPCIAPDYMQIDLLRNKMVKKRLYLGNKNPIQKLKYILAYKKYSPYKEEFLKFIK